MSIRLNKQKSVVVGGGNGSAIAICALKQNLDKLDISSVVSMCDSGGSSGILRKEFNTLPPGDIMRAVLAMSCYPYQDLRQIFYKPRFHDTGKLDAHNLGNLFLTLTSQFCGDFLQALEAMAQSVKAIGKVYPVSLQPTDLVAELDNGAIIRTEAFIDSPTYNRGLKIKKVWLEPRIDGYSEAIDAIESADYIFISPGSLYTSIIATLLPRGIKEAINNSPAKIIYIAGNAYQTDGETGPEKLSDIILQLEEYLPRQLDLVFFCNASLSGKQIKYYQEKKWGLIANDRDNIRSGLVEEFDYLEGEGGLSSDLLGVEIKSFLNKK